MAGYKRVSKKRLGNRKVKRSYRRRIKSAVAYSMSGSLQTNSFLLPTFFSIITTVGQTLTAGMGTLCHQHNGTAVAIGNLGGCSIPLWSMLKYSVLYQNLLNSYEEIRLRGVTVEIDCDTSSQYASSTYAKLYFTFFQDDPALTTETCAPAYDPNAVAVTMAPTSGGHGNSIRKYFKFNAGAGTNPAFKFGEWCRIGNSIAPPTIDDSTLGISGGVFFSPDMTQWNNIVSTSMKLCTIRTFVHVDYRKVHTL